VNDRLKFIYEKAETISFSDVTIPYLGLSKSVFAYGFQNKQRRVGAKIMFFPLDQYVPIPVPTHRSKLGYLDK
jgi:hypothetical protein